MLLQINLIHTGGTEELMPAVKLFEVFSNPVFETAPISGVERFDGLFNLFFETG